MKKLLIGAAFALSLATQAVHAAWPTAPVTIVVPFAAGQTGDIIARLIGKELATQLGQPFVVDNKPGSGGRTGTAFVAKAKPDGYTLLLTSTGPFALAPALYPKQTPYNPVQDFIGIAETASTPQVIAVSNQSGITSIADLVRQAKAKELAYGSAGNGSTQHLTMEMLKKEIGFPLVHVPFKGSAESKTQLIGGTLQATSDSLPAIYTSILGGQMRALAVVDDKRSPYLPNVPTLGEQGFPKLNTVAFFGLVAPKDTPREAVETVNKRLTALFKTPAFRERMKELALTPPEDRTADQFNAYLAAEVARWKKFVTEANIQVEQY